MPVVADRQGSLVRSRASKDPIVSHYTVLQHFYERVFGGTNIHFPLWFPKTKNTAEGAQNSNRLLAEASKLRSGLRVLDAGCGLGGSSFWVAERYEVKVVAISLVEANIRRCRQLAVEQGLEHSVHFQVSDFMLAPFRPDSFDVVWNLESFIYALPKDNYLRNTYRILKPGGIWACLDGFAGPQFNLDAKARARLSQANDGFVLTAEHWQSVSQLQVLLQQTGFRNLRWRDLTSEVLRTPRWRYVSALAVSLLDLRTIAPHFCRQWLKSFLAGYHIFRLMESKAIVYGLVTGEKTLA